MNARRIAELMRQQAALAEEIAREFDGEVAPEAEPPTKKVAPRRRTRIVVPPMLAFEPTDLDVRRAKDALRRQGVTVR